MKFIHVCVYLALLFSSFQISAGAELKLPAIFGDKVVLEFKHAYNGLLSKDGQPLTWFTIVGIDGKFIPAEAKIADKNEIAVSAAGVEHLVAVRFAWNQIAQPNLCSSAGLPAEPFSTEFWFKHNDG